MKTVDRSFKTLLVISAVTLAALVALPGCTAQKATKPLVESAKPADESKPAPKPSVTENPGQPSVTEKPKSEQPQSNDVQKISGEEPETPSTLDDTKPSVTTDKPPVTQQPVFKTLPVSPKTGAQPATTAKGGSSDGTGDVLKADEKKIRQSMLSVSLAITMSTMDFMMGSFYNTGSTREQVPTEPFDGQFKVDGGKILPKELYYLITQQFFELTSSVFSGKGAHPETDYPQIQFLKEGLCRDEYDNEGAASVITLNGKPGVCLSMQVLKSLPAEYMVETIASLFVHELSHIMGKDEALATEAQKWFGKYYKVRLDIGGFIGPMKAGWTMVASMNAVAEYIKLGKEKELCTPKEKISVTAWDFDKAIYYLRYKLHGFDIKWSDPNQKEYWGRKFSNTLWMLCGESPDPARFKTEFAKFHSEFKEFISQFGSIAPYEMYQ